jgi:hypothetical protein
MEIREEIDAYSWGYKFVDKGDNEFHEHGSQTGNRESVFIRKGFIWRNQLTSDNKPTKRWYTHT